MTGYQRSDIRETKKTLQTHRTTLAQFSIRIKLSSQPKHLVLQINNARSAVCTYIIENLFFYLAKKKKKIEKDMKVVTKQLSATVTSDYYLKLWKSQ